MSSKMSSVWAPVIKVVVTSWVMSPEEMGKLSMSRRGQGVILGMRGRE